MGSSYYNREFLGPGPREMADIRQREAEREAAKLAEVQVAKAKLDASLDALSRKLVMVVVDQVNAAIVRPGPKSEERECYEMAQELHEHKTELEALVRAVLVQHGVTPEPKAVDTGETGR